MPLARVDPADPVTLGELARLLEAARRVDDPDAFPLTERALQAHLTHGSDLRPSSHHLLVPEAGGPAVGALELELPTFDNHHLVWGEITVHPGYRHQGYGAQLLDELLARTRAAGRDTVWVGVAEDDAAGRAFLERHGFGYASHDARRRQVLADIDPGEIDRLEQVATQGARDYELLRWRPPFDDGQLLALAEVTAAINDAPMGNLTFEDEVFDLPRMRDQQEARRRRGDRFYEVVARHRGSGLLAGHTQVAVEPETPTLGHNVDTAVARGHRGHRLGFALKIAMLRWLAEAEPQLEVIETWNHADNTFMINVNEALGYRLSRVFALYELRLTEDEPVQAQAVADALA